MTPQPCKCRGRKTSEVDLGPMPRTGEEGRCRRGSACGGRVGPENHVLPTHVRMLPMVRQEARCFLETDTAAKAPLKPRGWRLGLSQQPAQGLCPRAADRQPGTDRAGATANAAALPAPCAPAAPEAMGSPRF